MEAPQRGRSPSAGHQSHIRHSPSPSPHGPYHSTLQGLGVNQSLQDNLNGYNQTFQDQLPSTGPNPYDIPPQFLQSNQSQQFSPPSITEHLFLQAQGAPLRSASPQFVGRQGNHFSPDLLDLNTAPGNPGNFDAQFFQGDDQNQNQSIDPSFLLDPNLLDPQPQQQNQSVNPANLMNHMATAQAQSPTPPHLLQPGMAPPSGSAHASPALSQGGFQSPGHSRHASLDPSSAAFPHGQTGGEWAGMAFRGHRRAPSDTYSDVSSVQHSPYLGNQESFDASDNPSPLLSAQQDPAMFQDVMQFGQFSLSEAQQSQISPGHSPHVSPRLIPQQHSLPPFTAANNFGLSSTYTHNQYNGQQGLDMFPGQGQEPFPLLQQGNGTEPGHADQMSPPEINIDFAPPSRQASFEPDKPANQHDALSPPDRSARGRMRAKSDPFSSASPRTSTPASHNSDPRSLSPNAAKLSSRSPSPAKASRRSSTSSIPHRDYILDLADPSRPTSSQTPGDTTINNPKRTQKHPATFQCSLCPKRFTRAYNLRSHLRTHTDERPFVCNVCGKAFARQHDRKRHEGLHSGEKKFVCRGQLKDGNNWGCGRRFARADALGRHFRSEAGRVCIRPLLEEEALEKGWDNHINQPGLSNGPQNPLMTNPMQPPMPGMQMAPQPGFDNYPPVSGGYDGRAAAVAAATGPSASYGLPAALLAQYPALAGLNWDALPSGPSNDDMEGDISGRSSFDANASSGGEYYEDEEGEYGNPNQQSAYGWSTNDYDARVS